MAASKIDPAFDGDHIVSVIKKSLASGKEMNFAFGFTGKSVDCVLIVHPTKSLASMLSECKALPNKTTKFAKGTFTVVEDVIRFKPENPIGGIVKGVEKRLKAVGVSKYSAILVDDSGGVIDESKLDENRPASDAGVAAVALAPTPTEPEVTAAADVVPDPIAEPQQPTVVVPPPPDPAKLAFAKRLMAVRAEVDRAVVRGDPAADKIPALLDSARQMVKDGNISGGNDILAALEKQLLTVAAAEPPAGTPAQPNVPDGPAAANAALKAEFFALFKAIGPKLKKAMEGPPPNPAAKRTLDSVIELSKKGNFADAIAALRSGDAASDAAPGSDADTASTTSPVHPATERWKKAREAWLDANDKLDSQLNALRMAILGEKSNPELADQLSQIAEVGLNALTGNYRVKLMGAIQAIGAGDSASLEKHADKALASIVGFKDYLDGNDKVDACEGNPWDVAVAIRDTLFPPLDAMSQALNMYRAAA